MNFLSHFYFDRHTSNPELVTGTVLPDLVRNANKNWNIRLQKRSGNFQSSEKLRSVFVGWQRHLDVDRLFHSSVFFTEHTRAIRTAVAPVLETSPVRPSFLAHISLELMLDSLLITENILDTDDFYNQLKLADRKTIRHFLELNKINSTSVFFDFFDQFIEASYLSSYRQAENILYALNRVCMRLWKDPLNETQKLQLTAVLLDYREHLQISFMDIFDEIGNRLKG